MRLCTPDEQAAVVGFFDAVAHGLSHQVIGHHELAVVERDGIQFVALVSHRLARLPKSLLGGDAGGLPVGTLEGGDFHLDLQGAVLLARKTKRQMVVVSEHAARLFLYGRNVLGESVEWHDPALERGDACIVANPRHEAMGIGVVVGSLKGTREAVRPVHDLGTYLRDQGEGD